MMQFCVFVSTTVYWVVWDTFLCQFIYSPMSTVESSITFHFLESSEIIIFWYALISFNQWMKKPTHCMVLLLSMSSMKYFEIVEYFFIYWFIIDITNSAESLQGILNIPKETLPVKAQMRKDEIRSSVINTITCN